MTTPREVLTLFSTLRYTQIHSDIRRFVEETSRRKSDYHLCLTYYFDNVLEKLLRYSIENIRNQPNLA